MSNIFEQNFTVKRTDRNSLNGHNSFCVWFTGLSGSGKSTVANALAELMHKKAIRTYTLDGDNIRHGLNKDLGFTSDDRTENLRRIAEVARLMIDAGNVVIASFISPLNEQRQMIQDIIGETDFYLIHVNTSLKTCEERDVKNLYARARKGEIPNFTGISSPYETPDKTFATIDTVDTNPEELAMQLFDKLKSRLK